MEALLNDYDILCIYEAMEDFTPLDGIDIAMYEAGFNKDEKKEKLWDRNKSVMVNSVNLLLAMIKKVKEMILGFLDSARNLVDYVFLKKEDKERYAEYEAYLRSNPAYKGKKVRVRDWRKVEKKYGEALKRVDRLEVQVNAGTISKEEASKEEQSIMDDVAKIGTTAISVVTADVALRVAKTSKDHAKTLISWLKRDQSLMDQMAKDMSMKDMKKFEKEMKKAANGTFFTRMRDRIYGKEQRDIVECINDTLKEVGNIDVSGKGKLSLITKNLGWGVKNRGIIKGGIKHGLLDKDTRGSINRVAEKGKEIKDTVDSVKGTLGLK